MSTAQETKFSPPKDLSHLLSEETKSREESRLKRFYKYFFIPGIGQLAGGLPSPAYFPFDNLISDVALPDRFSPTPNRPVQPPPPIERQLASANLDKQAPSSRLLVPHESGDPNRARKLDLNTALQYGTAEGYPPLREWLLRFVNQHMHPNVPYAGGPNIVLTCGATDGFAKTIQALNNAWVRGRDPLTAKEGLLVEEFAYMNAIQTASPRGMNIVKVAVDNEGMCADGQHGLRHVLETWDPEQGKRPHLLYTVTVGQNPTSGVLSVERRKAIYELCCRYDIVIIEDEPYWFLQYPSASIQAPSGSSSATGFPFLDSLVPSYLTLDTEGRVVRLDTFSKTIAPGCRLGWTTAQPALIERMLRITETNTQQPSGFVQSMVAELLVGPPDASPSPSSRTDGPGYGGGADGRGFQPSGWVRWLEGLRGNYERRMNAMCDVLDEGRVRVKSGRRPSLALMHEQQHDWTVIETDGAPLYSFQRPRGGMFVWVDVHFHHHPLWNEDGLTPPELSKALWILWTRKPALVLVSPGEMFAATEEVKGDKAWRFFRLCFAPCEENEVVGLSRRFVIGVQRFWAIRDAGIIRDLLKSDEEGTAGAEDIGSLMGPYC